MDVACAKAALRTLVYYDFVALLDIFQFSNVYLTTALFPGTGTTPPKSRSREQPEPTDSHHS
jgi:hypothetical protein